MSIWKKIGLAFSPNLAPIALGLFNIVTGNVLAGIGSLATGIGAAYMQWHKAQQESELQRSAGISFVRWYWQRWYVIIPTFLLTVLCFVWLWNR